MYSVTIDASGAISTIEVTLSLGAGETGRLEVVGEADAVYQDIALSSVFNGGLADYGRFVFASTVEPHTGSDGSRSRVRGVSLQDYTALWDEPVPVEFGAEILPAPPPRFLPVLYDIDKPLGSDLPTGEECEEQQLSGIGSAPGAASELMRSYVGQDVHLIPGPGLVIAPLEDGYSVRGKTVGQVLNELLLTNGVRWWLEGDLLIVDGRALPSGTFTVPAADRDEVISYEWSDAFATPEAEPMLSDYVGRCAENATYEEGTQSTVETSPNAVYESYEQSGVQSNENGTYATVYSKTVKSNGRVVSEVEKGTGYLGTPDGSRLGPTYLTENSYGYHTLVPDALVESVERTYTYADYGLLESLGGNQEAENTVMRDLWPSFVQQSPYISREVVVRQVWNAEGLLRKKITTSREFAGLTAIGSQVRLLYKVDTGYEDHLPTGRGFYRHKVSGRIAVDKPIYELAEGETGTEAEPIGIMRDSQPYSRKWTDESPGETVTIPFPSCREADTCLLEAERDYSRDHAAWEARQSNNPSKRTHQVTLAKLKFVRLGDSYGGALVTGVSHNVTRSSFSTSITAETAL
jgi:hypothetical protein